VHLVGFHYKNTIFFSKSYSFNTKFHFMLRALESMISFLWRCDPTRVMASPFTRFLDHTQRRTAVGRTLLCTSDHLVAETSTWQHTTLTTDKHPCSRWDSNPQSQQASSADLCLRPPVNWDWQSLCIIRWK